MKARNENLTSIDAIMDAEFGKPGTPEREEFRKEAYAYCMGQISGRKVYGGKWSVKSVRKFTPEELNLVSKAQVVESQYGNSACFFMNNGSTIYIPMANDAVSEVGDYLQLSECEIVTLEKLGESDITRIRG